MTEPVIRSAPGKLVLLGEYAVLFGHSALVTAIDRRARVALEASKRFRVHAPGLTPGFRFFELSDDGHIHWGDQEDVDLPLVVGVLRSLASTGLIEPQRLDRFAATLDTDSFWWGGGDDRVKLGLGSSAALTVAFASAVVDWAETDRRAEGSIEWLGTLLAIHRDFQGGRGSGIDLAASLLGGTLEYRLNEQGGIALAEPVTLPDGLHTVFAWTGRSADTGLFLEQLRARRAQDPRPVDDALEALGTISVHGIEALREARVDGFLSAVADFGTGLEELGRAAGLEIISDEHRRLAEIAHRCGAVYKPSGAGGGDVGVAFTDDAEVARSFAEGVGRAGFDLLEVSPDPDGLK
jgi:phosphomevalonate kinase